MNNFWQRILTGSLFLIVMIGSILIGPYSLLGLFALIIILSLREFYSLCESEHIHPQSFSGIAGGFILIATTGFAEAGLLEWKYAIMILPLIFSVFIIELYRNRKDPFTNIAYTLFGITYIALPFTLLALAAFREGVYFFQVPLGYFIILWTYDSGAYVAGRSIGRTKLFERISPKKTWEGSVGGGLLSLGVAYLMSTFFDALPLTDWLVVAVLVIVTGTLGDLSESMFKRTLNVKDSGSILPGHGGMLDRFDAVFISAPFVFTWLFIRGY
jgi:phosphatidate cytidylyltransferase